MICIAYIKQYLIIFIVNVQAKLTASQQAKQRVSRTPIIVIPAGQSSLISMHNAREILQDLK